MEFGLVLPTFPFDKSNENQFITQLQDFLKDSQGIFKSAWMGDHLIPWSKTFESKPMVESFTTMTYLSGIFTDLKFGNVVLNNSLRNPALLARMGATFHILTGGRFILGIGAGWLEREFSQYGYGYPPTKVRLGQLEEAVQVIKRLWTEGTVTFEGKYYRLKSAECYPILNPRPPIMIGGTGEKLTPVIVAKHADWYNLPNVSPNVCQHKLEVLRDACQEVHRDFAGVRKTLINLVAIAENSDDARKILSLTPYSTMGAEENLLVGNPEHIRDKLREYQRIGIDLSILRFLDFPNTNGMRLFENRVISSF